MGTSVSPWKEAAERAGSPGAPHRLAMHFRPELTGHLPHTDRRFRFGSCALVGNSGSLDGAGLGQGLTLVHFSTQPQPFLTQTTPCTPHYDP
jgi:hypothetical protein